MASYLSTIRIELRFKVYSRIIWEPCIFTASVQIILQTYL